MQHEDFYVRTKRLCKEKNITIEGLMISIGLTKDTYAKWRRRSTFPKSDDLLNMSKTLGVSMEFLLTGKEETHTTTAQLVYDYMEANMPGTLSDILNKMQLKNLNSGKIIV